MGARPTKVSSVGIFFRKRVPVYMSRVVALSSSSGTRGIISRVCRAPYDRYQSCRWKFKVIAIRPADVRQTAPEPIAALGLLS